MSHATTYTIISIFSINDVSQGPTQIDTTWHGLLVLVQNFSNIEQLNHRRTGFIKMMQNFFFLTLGIWIYWCALIGWELFVIDDWLHLKNNNTIGARLDFEFRVSSMTDYGYGVSLFDDLEFGQSWMDCLIDYGYEVSLLDDAKISAIMNGLPYWLRLKMMQIFKSNSQWQCF